jgi:hypothetical protein
LKLLRKDTTYENVKKKCPILNFLERWMPNGLSSFIGRSVKEQDFVHLPGVLAVAEGYNGQVAVFSKRSFVQIFKRKKMTS